jgi:hypothetical protein
MAQAEVVELPELMELSLVQAEVVVHRVVAEVVAHLEAVVQAEVVDLMEHFLEAVAHLEAVVQAEAVELMEVAEAVVQAEVVDWTEHFLEVVVFQEHLEVLD